MNKALIKKYRRYTFYIQIKWKLHLLLLQTGPYNNLLISSCVLFEIREKHANWNHYQVVDKIDSRFLSKSVENYQPRLFI